MIAIAPIIGLPSLHALDDFIHGVMNELLAKFR